MINNKLGNDEVVLYESFIHFEKDNTQEGQGGKSPALSSLDIQRSHTPHRGQCPAG